VDTWDSNKLQKVIILNDAIKMLPILKKGLLFCHQNYGFELKEPNLPMIYIYIYSMEPFIITPERYGLLTMAIGEVSDRTKTYRNIGL